MPCVTGGAARRLPQLTINQVNIMKLTETVAEFQATIGRIAAVAGLTPEAVYALWETYEAESRAADQSAILHEFVRWYKAQLGGNVEQLDAALVEPEANEPQPPAEQTQVEAPQPKKWTVDSTNPPGPIQVNKFNKAHGGFRMAHGMMRELSGIIGGEEIDHTRMVLFGGSRADVTAAQVEIGTRFNWTVSRANVGEIISAIEAALVELKKTVPIVDKRITAEAAAQRDAEHAKARAEREEQDRKRNAESAKIVTELRAKYPWALPSAGMRTGPRAAANCKAELQRTWPAVTWSVRSDHNSMRVSWNDGPTEKQVKEITAKYQDGHFDGMTDSHEYDRSAYGCAVDEVLGRVTYLSLSRGYGERYHTMKIQNDVAGWILALEGIEAGGRELWDVRIPRFENGSGMGATTAARMLLDATELPAGATVTGVEWNKVSGGLNVPENWYKLVLAVPEFTREVGTSSAGGALGTVARNHEHNGVEISFFEKPSDSLRDSLKRAGFRITRRPPWKWYQRWSESAYARACQLAGVKAQDVTTGNQVEEHDPAGGYVQAQEEAYFDRQAEAIGA